jgi:hypothetical protein
VKGLSYDDEETIAADVSLHLMVRNFHEDLKANHSWFIDLTRNHYAAAEKMLKDQGELFSRHSPVFDIDGVECAGGDVCCQGYPCRIAESLHDGTGIWDELIKSYPADWRDQAAVYEQDEIEDRARMRKLYPDESW